ncbi:plakophilin-2 isoform X2 [Nelusetta ayraudi]|uniref:plakophilin-2 isoform X2 n=1 Tax=Nelusetta ayraudi TaxID=303726 RepID=UPI003F719202
MDQVFFKSTLPADDSLRLRDSSLALPAEPSLTSPEGRSPNERSVRVHQQVQLTLARRSRRTAKPPGLVSGSVHLHQNTARSFDAAERPPVYTKVNRVTFSNHSLSSGYERKPSRRVEVSPPRTPTSPPSRFSRSAFFYSTYSHPPPSQPRRCLLPDYSFCNDSFRQCASSEVRGRGGVPQLQTSPPPPADWFQQRSVGQSVRRSSSRSHWQVSAAAAKTAAAKTAAAKTAAAKTAAAKTAAAVVEEEEEVEVKEDPRQTAQGQSAETSPAVQTNGGLAWLAKVRSGGQQLQRLLSFESKGTSVEVDAESPIQKAPALLNLEEKPPEMTMERAVNLLSQDSEETLVSAATYIQNQCLKSNDAKKMLCCLHGIDKLLALLCSDEEVVQRAAAGALRNVVYQNDENKMEVKEKDGLATALAALKSSRDAETRRELTGLLWNLSSHDLLKESLTRQALPVLTKSVLVPSSGLSEGENPKDELLADAVVFHNATGCLLNLSSAGPDGRGAMRGCEDLIDSLVYYVRGAIADFKSDDKIEAELPNSYARDFGEPLLKSLAPEPKAVGCFAHRSAKITEHMERQRPLLEDKANPSGIEWLWSAITIRMYLSLIARSVRQSTLEAAVGALQNITAGNGALSEAITFTIVQRESGLHHIRKLLEDGEVNVRSSAVSLIRNLSRYQELHPVIVEQELPELVEMLPDDDDDGGSGGNTQLPAEVTASLCHILNNLSQSDKQHVRAIINEGGLPKIISISTRGSSDSGLGQNRASQAACVLLHTMWRHTDLHGVYKKCGYKKSDFIS